MVSEMRMNCFQTLLHCKTDYSIKLRNGPIKFHMNFTSRAKLSGLAVGYTVSFEMTHPSPLELLQTFVFFFQFMRTISTQCVV